MEKDPDTMIPIHVELEEHVPPGRRNLFEDEEPIEPMPRSRAPRSSVHDIPAIDLDDDEITNLVRKPSS